MWPTVHGDGLKQLCGRFSDQRTRTFDLFRPFECCLTNFFSVLRCGHGPSLPRPVLPLKSILLAFISEAAARTSRRVLRRLPIQNLTEVPWRHLNLLTNSSNCHSRPLVAILRKGFLHRKTPMCWLDHVGTNYTFGIDRPAVARPCIAGPGMESMLDRWEGCEMVCAFKLVVLYESHKLFGLRSDLTFSPDAQLNFAFVY
jgi:hypothetical protein